MDPVYRDMPRFGRKMSFRGTARAPFQSERDISRAPRRGRLKHESIYSNARNAILGAPRRAPLQVERAISGVLRRSPSPSQNLVGSKEGMGISGYRDVPVSSGMGDFRGTATGFVSIAESIDSKADRAIFGGTARGPVSSGRVHFWGPIP